jgi:glycosyltransferase involved in cell wall biosynthesis
LKRKIVIVTAAQPSANPRVVKEATALAEAGYKVSVIYTSISPWADKYDNELFAATPNVEWIRTGYNAIKQPLKFKFVRLRRKLYEKLYINFLVNNSPENAFTLYAPELKKKAQLIKANLYIAHNLGALPAAVIAAQKWKAAAAFDAEDFHRGEDAIGSVHYRLALRIENKYFVQLSYLSTASPLIRDCYKKHFPNQNFFTINNAFSKAFLQPPPTKTTEGLSLFWFSQKVGSNRGLEIIVLALNKLTHLNISFGILGYCCDTYKEELVKISAKPSSISFLPQVSLEDVFKIAATYDVGLASEIPYCENRDVCLTNKLFTYLMCSNCVIASNTSAQKDFFSNYPGVGVLYKNDDPTDLARKIEELYINRGLLAGCRRNAYDLAKSELNWQNESEKLLLVVDKILSESNLTTEADEKRDN